MDYSKFRHITTFIFDVDGVFTNSEVLVTEQGEMLRTFNVKDGQAMIYALNAGYKVFIITKAFSEGVKKRFEFLGATEIHYKLKEKTSTFNSIVERFALSKKEMLYMGDDLPDVPLFDRVGIVSCPCDAVPEVISRAEYISPYKGGQGCVREIIEKVMRLRGDWPGLHL